MFSFQVFSTSLFCCLVQPTGSSEAKFMYFMKWMKNLIDEEGKKTSITFKLPFLLSGIFNT